MRNDQLWIVLAVDVLIVLLLKIWCEEFRIMMLASEFIALNDVIKYGLLWIYGSLFFNMILLFAQPIWLNEGSFEWNASFLAFQDNQLEPWKDSKLSF